MNIPSHLLPPDWLFFTNVVGVLVLWQAIRHAPWRQLRAARLQQLFFGSVVDNGLHRHTASLVEDFR